MFIKGMRLIYSSFTHTPCTNIVVTSTNALAIRLEFYC